MSEARDIIGAVVSERENWTAETCKNLADGTTFNAEVEQIQDIELNVALGRDARESVTIHVLNQTAADGLTMNGFVSIQLYGRWQKFQVLRRSNNPASPQVEFGLMKVLPKDAQ